MASRALARVAKVRPITNGLCAGSAEADRPVILHWLGDMFDPALAGYWGADAFEPALETALAVIEMRRRSTASRSRFWTREGGAAGRC